MKNRAVSKKVAAQKLQIQTYEQAKALRDHVVWTKLQDITVEETISQWLATLTKLTRINYRSGLYKLIDLGLINPLMTLQEFALINHDSIIDQIKLINGWSECSRQSRAACYIALTGFLSRRSQGMIKKASPNREGNAKTFYRVYDKVKTHAMTQAQWVRFLEALEQINYRDALIAKVILQGGKRINEVLSLQTNKIDWQRCEITFQQSKMKGVRKETVITYPETFMKKLNDYIGPRSGHVFITRSSKPIGIKQLAITFAKAGRAAGLPFKITPHVLRASTVTYLKQQGFPDSDIMRVTGHASSEMVYAYDKSSRSDNASKKVQLIS